MEDDQIRLTELFDSFEQENTNFNQIFTIDNFKLPEIISDFPLYASLCIFFCRKMFFIK